MSGGTAMVMSLKVGKASPSAEVMERVKSFVVVVRVACTAFRGEGNSCSTKNVRSEGLAGQGKRRQ